MARKTTFSELIEQVRAEARISTAVSQGQANENYLKQLIKRYYDHLYDEYDWPFKRILKSEARVTILAGSRYYDYPPNLDLERIFKLYVQQGNQWIEVPRNIGPEQYNVHDSDNNSRADPVLRWDVYSDTQFEVWPLPASAGTVWFDGIKRKTPLIANTDRCDLDDTMLVLFVASEVLAATNQKDSQIKLNAAQARLIQLKGKMSANRPDFSFSDDGYTEQAKMPRILVTANVTAP
jgi:hypothetical protein